MNSSPGLLDQDSLCEEMGSYKIQQFALLRVNRSIVNNIYELAYSAMALATSSVESLPPMS
jgi:hypothetical protein